MTNGALGLPLRMNGMHRTQFEHARLDLLSLEIWSRVFWLSVAWNLRKAQRSSKSASLLPALRDLWLLLVSKYWVCKYWSMSTFLLEVQNLTVFERFHILIIFLFCGNRDFSMLGREYILEYLTDKFFPKCLKWLQKSLIMLCCCF